jgi:hypothetical protein
MAINSENFYQRLTRLFRSGPAIRKKIKGQNYKNFYDTAVLQNNLGYYGASSFKREASPFSILGAFSILDRMSRYAEFAEMDMQSSEVNAALDVVADESCATDEHGRTFHIYSDNPQIQKALEELFYDVMNIELDGRRMFRNLAKNGDFFAYVEVVPDYGIVRVEPIPVNEVIRQEGFDAADPYAVRFQFLNKGGKYLENWQVFHLRNLSNDLFLPYGTSFLESARRVFRQLSMLEDAMLVYRVVRSPERRVFYIDVSAIAPTDIPSYMEAVKETMRGANVIDRIQGRQDLRYNPVAVDEDYFLPAKPNSQTKIETLAGGQHVSATEDVEYIQKKLIAALKVPRAYLTFDESIGSKATLAQEDIRFSRTISSLQKIVISELSKLAIIHLYAKGFDGEDLLDYELRFSNPSTVAMQQKLQIITSRIDAATKAWELAKETGMMDMEYIQTEILGFRLEQIVRMRIGAQQDQLRIAELKKLSETVLKKEEDPIVDPFAASNYEVPGPGTNADVAAQQAAASKTPPMGAQIRAPEEGGSGAKLISVAPGKAPISANPTPKIAAPRKRDRKKSLTGLGSMPDFAKMLSGKNRSTSDVYDMEFIKKPILTEFFAKSLDEKVFPNRLSIPCIGMLKRMNEVFSKNKETIDIELINEEKEETDPLQDIELELSK